MASMGARIKHAFNSFLGSEDDQTIVYEVGPSSTTRPDRPRARYNNERTIISSIYTRLSVDVAGIKIEHVRTDDDGQYQETIKSGLNECLNIRANLDQFGRHFRQDMPLSLFQQGCIAILPVDTTVDPNSAGNWDIKTMRVGEILQWYPQHVRVRAYNEKTGQREELTVPKTLAAIVENPFYSVMNEPNSTLQRLISKLSLLDHVDEISSSGKLDIIIQLPYVVKSETRKNQARQRTEDIKDQLQGSTYGIAYTDGTEKITQLNRSVENNLLEQVKYLKAEVYNELGLTEGIMNGTADDVETLNYTNRIIEPVMDAITEAMIGTFLTKTARSQNQTLMYFQTPFKLIPIGQLGDLIDVLSRNQVVTSNEIRPTLGLKPSKEPQANQLLNANMPVDKQITAQDALPVDPADAEEANLDKQMADLGLS